MSSLPIECLLVLCRVSPYWGPLEISRFRLRIEMSFRLASDAQWYEYTASASEFKSVLMCQRLQRNVSKVKCQSVKALLHFRSTLTFLGSLLIRSIYQAAAAPRTSIWHCAPVVSEAKFRSNRASVRLSTLSRWRWSTMLSCHVLVIWTARLIFTKWVQQVCCCRDHF
jgi:hypothetical protein